MSANFGAPVVPQGLMESPTSKLTHWAGRAAEGEQTQAYRITRTIVLAHVQDLAKQCLAVLSFRNLEGAISKGMGLHANGFHQWETAL